MLIGQDFDKIEFEFLGLDLLEPNSFIGDFLIFIVAMVFAYKTFRFGKQNVFFVNWTYFFLIFGVGFLLGGLSHLLYNYWGIPGKTPSWYLSILAVFFLEKAMISLHQNKGRKRLFLTLSKVKLGLALVAALAVSIFVDLEADYSKGMQVPTINSTIGLAATLGFLAYTYSKKIKGFKYFLISVPILIPAAFFQAMKINFHPWFDKNDATHTLIFISTLFYFAGIKSYAKYVSKTKISENA